MKTTAVEFAVEQLEQLIPFGNQLAVRIILEQALEREKQQHKETWFESASQFANESEMLSKKDFEQYYDETYNK
jgi:hypothetical protein